MCTDLQAPFSGKETLGASILRFLSYEVDTWVESINFSACKSLFSASASTNSSSVVDLTQLFLLLALALMTEST